MALRSISLCAGIGGLDLGLARWARSVCYVERDAYAAAVLVARMEDALLDPAPIWSDLTTFDARAWRGSVDLVTGGYPCQPFSHVGRRRGTDDERHIWPHVARILRDSGAQLGFFENVSGHVSLGLSDVLAELADMGFDAEWCCVRASDVGAPHRRERLFILAYARRDGCPIQRRSEVMVRETGAREADREERKRDGDSVGDGGQVVGHPAQPRLEERGRPGGCRRPDAWPPGPQDADGWRRWIAQGGPEPVVRRGADGSSARMDRLRCLGNAVVPDQAALAWNILTQRMLEEKNP